MKSMTRTLIAGAAMTALTVVNAAAQTTVTQPLTVTATVAGRAVLTLGAASVDFPDADPGTTPIITAAPGLSVTARARTGSLAVSTLTVQAGADLISGSDSIPIGNLTWTASGAGFVAGTMSSAAGQSLASFTGGGSYTGTQTYSLVNDWAYVPGVYTATITYTLTVP